MLGLSILEMPDIFASFFVVYNILKKSSLRSLKCVGRSTKKYSVFEFWAVREAAKKNIFLMAVSLRPSPFNRIGSRIFFWIKESKKRDFFLNGKPINLTPSPPLNGTAIKKRFFFGFPKKRFKIENSTDIGSRNKQCLRSTTKTLLSFWQKEKRLMIQFHT